MSKPWIDISVPIYSGMTRWPDNPPVAITQMLEMAKGAVCNVSLMAMGAHTGTHMDGQNHFIRDGKGVDEVPFEAVIGRARVIEIKDKVCIKPEELRPHKIKRGERILFKTRNSARSWKTDAFDEDFVFISKEAAQHLVDCGIQTVGVDYLSVGGFRRDGVETHQILLGAEVWIIEGLNLSKVKPGKYDLLCLPLKIRGCDGAPCRALLR